MSEQEYFLRIEPINNVATYVLRRSKDKKVLAEFEDKELAQVILKGTKYSQLQAENAELESQKKGLQDLTAHMQSRVDDLQRLVGDLRTTLGDCYESIGPGGGEYGGKLDYKLFSQKSSKWVDEHYDYGDRHLAHCVAKALSLTPAHITKLREAEQRVIEAAREEKLESEKTLGKCDCGMCKALTDLDKCQGSVKGNS